MKMIRPMGALGLQSGQKGKDKLESLYNNPRYVAEKKFDGCRYTIQIDLDGKIYLQSRSESVDGGMVDKTDRVPQIIEEAKSIDKGTILDGEIDIPEGRYFHYVQGCMGSLPERAIALQTGTEIHTEIINKKIHFIEGPKLVYKVFDILEYKGQDLRNEPLCQRRSILEHIASQNIFKFIILVDQVKDEEGKRKLFDEEIEKGSEGIILKNLDSIYVEGEEEGKRPSNTWYKNKLVNTYDGVVVGYNLGTGKNINTVGSLRVSQYKDGELVEVADCGGLKDSLRDEFKQRIDSGERFIIEFKAQEPETNRYRHPRYKRERLDKTERQCVYGQI